MLFTTPTLIFLTLTTTAIVPWSWHYLEKTMATAAALGQPTCNWHQAEEWPELPCHWPEIDLFSGSTIHRNCLVQNGVSSIENCL